MKTDWPTILYFGNDWSADNRTSSHHIARRLMRDYRLIYVECPGLRTPQGTSRDIKKIFSKLGKIFQGPRKVPQGAIVYTLFQIPFHRFKFVRWLNRWIIIRSLRALCKRLKVENPILWFVVPHLAMVLGQLKESLRVYYCIDDYASLPGVHAEMVQAMDQKMTEESDIVFVSSQPLLESKKQYGDKVVLSRHGVDFEHFNKVYTNEIEAADDVKDLTNPVLGFFGLIENWIDLDLLKFLAESRPQWNILMIGRVAVSQNPCEGMKNVHFLGPRSYEVLPQYAKMFDVAMIPCKNNDLIYNFNPLKLREYLAMGTPVVSTQFPEISDFIDVVEVADGYKEFLEKVDWVLENDDDKKIKERINKVKSSSWENRFQWVVETVNRALNKKLSKN